MKRALSASNPHNRSWSAPGLALPVLALAFGCSAGTDDPTHASSTADLPGEIPQVGTAREAITFPGQITGLANDSNPATLNFEQAETQLNFSFTSNTDVIQTVTYNDFTGVTAIVSGTTLMGYSVSTGGSAPWVHKKVTPLSTFPVLWGDPAMTSQPNDNRFVYISNIAVPASKFPSSGVITDDIEDHLGGACIARSSDRGQNFTVAQCLSDNNHLYDGGTLAAGGANNGVIAAYWDVDSTAIDLWIASGPTAPFALQSPNTSWDPFPSFGAFMHPKLSVDAQTGATAIVTVGSFLSLAYNVAPNFGGFTGIKIVDAPVAAGDTMTLANGRAIRLGPEYDVEIGKNESGVLESRMVYTKRGADGHLHIYGARCTVAAPVTCQTVPAWSTEQLPSAHDEFQPSMTYANGEWVVAYYTTLFTDGTQVGIAGQRFTGDGTQAHPFSTTFGNAAGPISPCPRSNYWGDYNDIKYNKSQNQFVTTFTSNGCTPFHVQEGAFSL